MTANARDASARGARARPAPTPPGGRGSGVTFRTPTLTWQRLRGICQSGGWRTHLGLVRTRGSRLASAPEVSEAIRTRARARGGSFAGGSARARAWVCAESGKISHKKRPPCPCRRKSWAGKFVIFSSQRNLPSPSVLMPRIRASSRKRRWLERATSVFLRRTTSTRDLLNTCVQRAPARAILPRARGGGRAGASHPRARCPACSSLRPRTTSVACSRTRSIGARVDATRRGHPSLGNHDPEALSAAHAPSSSPDRTHPLAPALTARRAAFRTGPATRATRARRICSGARRGTSPGTPSSRARSAPTRSRSSPRSRAKPSWRGRSDADASATRTSPPPPPPRRRTS
jgi:hypothetical protein